MNTESLTLLVAFGAGVLSFASPCVLPLVPAYVGHLAGQSLDKEEPEGRPGRAPSSTPWPSSSASPPSSSPWGPPSVSWATSSRMW